jgi:hypothetical protein
MCAECVKRSFVSMGQSSSFDCLYVYCVFMFIDMKLHKTSGQRIAMLAQNELNCTEKKPVLEKMVLLILQVANFL